MDDKLLEYFIDPVKGKIILEINHLKRASVKDLCAKCSDIPRSTMYRHLAKLEKEGIIEVVEVTQKRGTVEKTYALNESRFDISDAGTDVDPKAYLAFFVHYCMTFIEEFKCAVERPGFELKDNPSGFTTAPIYATDKELEHLMYIVGGALSPLTENAATPDRKAYSIGVIVTPPKN